MYGHLFYHKRTHWCVLCFHSNSRTFSANTANMSPESKRSVERPLGGRKRPVSAQHIDETRRLRTRSTKISYVDTNAPTDAEKPTVPVSAFNRFASKAKATSEKRFHPSTSVAHLAPYRQLVPELVPAAPNQSLHTKQSSILSFIRK